MRTRQKACIQPVGLDYSSFGAVLCLSVGERTVPSGLRSGQHLPYTIFHSDLKKHDALARLPFLFAIVGMFMLSLRQHLFTMCIKDSLKKKFVSELLYKSSV